MNSLYHHGIEGQKWGVRHGPPYPLKGGSYERVKKKKLRPANKVKKTSDYFKKHYDKTIKANTRLQTLSHNPNRLKNTSMFFASYDPTDNRHYRYLFNHKAPENILDEDGNVIGTGMFYKKLISSHPTEDLKIASEDSGSAAFKKLFEERHDFYNFVTKRMEDHFNNTRYMFRKYRQMRPALEKMKTEPEKLTETDMNLLYRMFNYVLPSAGPTAKSARDMARQRALFFKELKKEGYSGVLDTNDALNGAYHANAPVIIFDMDKIIPDSVKQLDFADRAVSFLAYRGRKMMGK